MATIFNYEKLVEYTPTSGTQPVRTEFSDGKVQSVNRYTKHYTNATVTFILTLAQTEEFITWFSLNGHDYFDLDNPITQQTKSYRIVGGYNFNRLGTYRHYQLSLNVERLL